MQHHPALIAGSGAAVGTLGGLIGLGGAEFRLPLLIGVFGFGALPAIILNKATSLVVVAASLPLRLPAVPLADMLARWDAPATLLAGSLAGAWLAAGWATRMASPTLHRVLALLLVLMAAALLLGHRPDSGGAALSGPALMIAGVGAGLAIGAVASLLGVAGGELLIPTLVLLFGVDIALAGSLSLAVSLPTLLVGFARYSRDRAFEVLRGQRRFVGWMAAGSIAGVVLGAALLHALPGAALAPLLAGILLLSAVKLWRHR